jgi:small-conductance mechanosensitive channel
MFRKQLEFKLVKGEKVKILNSIFAVLLFSGVAVAQAPAKTDPAPTPAPTATTAAPQPTKPIPQLTTEEETQILFLQRNIARIDVNISAEEKQQVQFKAQLAQLANNIQKRLGPGFVIDPDTLVVSAAPAPATPAAVPTDPKK